MAANELLCAGEIAARVKRLQRKHDLKFTVAFDTGGKRISKSWKSNYAVLDFTAALPQKASGIPDDLYNGAIGIFKSAQKTVDQARTFFCLRFAPRLKNPSWSVELFLSDRDLAGKHILVRDAAQQIVLLMSRDADFRKTCSDGPHLLVAYTEREKRVIGFQSQVPVAFDEPYSESTKVEQELMSDNCGKNITQMSGVFLGNVGYARKDYRAAIEHWERAADAGVKDAPFCVACANSMLGNMEQTFEFCKRAIQIGDSPDRLNEPELAPFRRHPLFAKLKEWLKTKRTARRVPSPITRCKIPMPEWNVPKNLKQLVEEADGVWEDDRWDPILLTVMSDTSYQGRDIPIAWQIEFEPFDDRFKAASEKINASGVEPDGDGWSSVVEKEFIKRYPKLAREFHSDSESSTCVLWVESENACQKLIAVVWSLMHPSIG